MHSKLNQHLNSKNSMICDPVQDFINISNDLANNPNTKYGPVANKPKKKKVKKGK